MLYFNTFSRYLFWQNCRYFVNVTVILILALFLANIFDTMERTNSTTLTAINFLKFSLYKIPYFLNEIVMVITMISTLLFLKNMITTNEYVGALVQGISTVHIFFSLLTSALFIGIIFIFVVGPLGAHGLQKYDNLKLTLDKNSKKDLVIADSGIFISEEWAGEKRMMQIKSLHISDQLLMGVTIVFLDEQYNYIKRVDAESFKLNNDTLYTNKAHLSLRNNSTIINKDFSLKTNLDFKDFTNKFTLPENITIYKLPKFAQRLSFIGVSAIKYQLYFYKQLFKPLTLILAVLLAGCFIKLSRFNKLNIYTLLTVGLLIGFIIYALIQTSPLILVNNNLNPVISTLMPIILMILATSYIILHFD